MEVGKRRVGAMSSWVSGTLEMADRPGLLDICCEVSDGCFCSCVERGVWEVQWEGYRQSKK